MPELLHPGVYVLETPSAVRPIEGVSTSTAAFIGMSDKGPVPGQSLPTGKAAQPQMVTSLTDYYRTFGSYRQDSYLTYAVRSFFDNGGRRLYIARVVGLGSATAVAGNFVFEAQFAGKWSGLLTVDVLTATNGVSTDFNVVVHAAGPFGPVVVETVANVPIATARTFLNANSKFVTMTSNPTVRPPNLTALSLPNGNDGTAGTPASVTVGTSLQVAARFPGDWADATGANVEVKTLSPSGTTFTVQVLINAVVVETFANVAINASPAPGNYVKTVLSAQSRYITVTADCNALPTVDAQSLSGGADGVGAAQATAGLSLPGSTSVSALNPGAWGNLISVQVAPSSDGDASNFKITVADNGIPVETFDRVTWAGSPTTLPGATNPAEDASVVVNAVSQYIAITNGLSAAIPSTGGFVPLAGGADGNPPQLLDYIGAAAATNLVAGTGLHALDKLTDVNIVAIPGQGDPQAINAGMDYCKNRQLSDCFFVADVGTIDITASRDDNAATDINQLSDVVAFATSGFGSPALPLDKAAGDYGAVYYPWVWASDPIGSGRNPRILLPPSGFVTGLYARIDNSRGVFKAPAGIEAGVMDALAAANNVSDAEQDLLNPICVNAIRTVPGSGFVVWGARTIGSDASWRYIPVRRMAIFLRVSIYYGIQWAVFEPNDEPLWSSLRMNIRAFMMTQFRAGAFQGSKPDDAFFVKCDSTTTTQTDIDNGVVNILVGFAPLKPAEFVVLKLSQKVNQPTA